MSSPSWRILIPTVPERGDLFARLLDRLLPQLGEHEGRVQVCAWRNIGEPHLGAIRDRMIDCAHRAGVEYVSFIDDDDLVPDYYVAETVRALETRPDHVGFKLEFVNEGGAAGREVVEHSLKWGKWGRSIDGILYRNFTHVDPIRTELARQGRFAHARRGRAEDRKWVRQIAPLVKTETYIDKIMYHYLYAHDNSVWTRRQGDIRHTGVSLPAIDHPHFQWQPESV